MTSRAEKQIQLQGTADDKIMTCLQAAGWYAGRCVDLTEVRAFYASCGIVLSPAAERFLGTYYGIAEGWYFNEPEGAALNRAPDLSFSLYPLHTREDAAYPSSEMNTEERQRVGDFAGEPVLYVGDIGYYYPGFVYVGDSGRLYTAHDYDDLVHCYAALPELLRYDFDHAAEWHSVRMKRGFA